MDVIIYILLLLVILAATFLTILGGIGAAFIIIPLLLAFGYPIALASIIGLSFNFISTSTASIRHYRQNSIDFQISIPIILVSLIGAPTGALLVNYIPSGELKLVFAIVLLLIGFNNIVKLYSSATQRSNNSFEKDAIRQKLLLSVIAGFFVGLVSGLLGIGGGALLLPLLLYFNLPAKKAAGTTSFIVVFSSLIGVISKLVLNDYEFDYVLFYGGIIISIIGAVLGSYAMHYKLKQSHIKLVISMLIISVGIKMIFDYL